ncbi:hypothetical protein [Red seabream iridovirus]|uniref:ORF005L n=2 Tax=Infectious spleen and kidney necrosis virus TaxID=180170 RepID=Q5YF82_ISKNV|nr:ORF005L [Rock bream iridovirus]AAX82314.1 ORF5L [Orange-spotted grouper iridovirus]AGG37884.1 hypothetical protein [Rock bream iridovirus]UNA01233.1 hypothetical protein [Red seabream iridovirus]UWH19157.1 hypothetical protein [Infectious spleen and kidney necrosis virus]
MSCRRGVPLPDHGGGVCHHGCNDDMVYRVAPVFIWPNVHSGLVCPTLCNRSQAAYTCW